MAKNLTAAKLSSLAKSLSGREAAFLVIDYQMRGEKEKKNYSDEVKTIVSTVSHDNVNRLQEYIFYHDLWRTCGLYSLDLQTNLMSLEIYTWKLEAIKQLVYESCFKYRTSWFMDMLPKYYTKEQHDNLYGKCKEKMLTEQIPVASVAQYEAFHRLKEEKLIQENVYYLVDDVFENNKELEKTFDKFVAATLVSLESDIKKGLLKAIKVKDKTGWYHSGEDYIGTRGITGESWYNYDKKLNKGYNEIIDDREKLVEFYEGECAIAMGMAANVDKEDKGLCWAEKRRMDMINGLREGLSVNVKDGVVSYDTVIGSVVEKLTVRINDCIQKAVNHWEILKKVQEVVFDNKIKLGDNAVEKAPGAIKKPKEEMDKLIDHTLRSLEMSIISKKPKLKNAKKLQIITDPKPDEVFVEEQFKWLISTAEKESGFKWKV